MIDSKISYEQLLAENAALREENAVLKPKNAYDTRGIISYGEDGWNWGGGEDNAIKLKHKQARKK